MKNLLYYENVMLQQFTAQVVKTGQDEVGNYIVLDNTAFYPTGGGQPHDTGRLGELEITAVEKADDEIRHYTPDEMSNISGEITGSIDWERRFDHMQQHAGQHIITAAFVELFDIATVSFHLGTALSTIDLDVGEITEQQLAAAEKRANKIILENRPIETKWVTKEELGHYNLRKDVTVEEDIRLVIIPDYDYNGCGGTHPTATGQVGLVKILATEKMKQHIRVHFVCGHRVLEQLAMRKQVLSDVARQLHAPEEEAAEALRKFSAAARQTEKSLMEAQDALLDAEAKSFASEPVAAAIFEGRPIQSLQKLARSIIQQNAASIALLVADNDDKLQFVAACGSEQSVSMKTVSAAVLPLLNGKGGGNDGLVQGGGEKNISAHALLDAMKKALQ